MSLFADVFWDKWLLAECYLPDNLEEETGGEGEQEENNMLNVQLEKKCNNLTWIKNLDWKTLRKDHLETGHL